MPARKMRVELFDSDGSRYTIAFEGEITREKAVRLIDLVELLGGVQNSSGTTAPAAGIANNNLSKYEKVHTSIRRSFPLVWFSSKEVQAAYEQVFREPISLSTVATYLSRLTNDGVLARAGSANRLKYKVSAGLPQVAVNQQIP
jgi:hypothetical protein